MIKSTAKDNIIQDNNLHITLKATTDKYISLLFDVIQNKDRDWDKWFKIAGILKTLSEKEG